MAYIVIALILGVLWLIAQIFEGIGNTSKAIMESSKKKEEFFKKFGERQVDKTLSLEERNQDIIDYYLVGLKAPSYKEYYYIDNKVRDCINDITFAEGRSNSAPGSYYLSNWRNNAPEDLKALSNLLVKRFEKRIEGLGKVKEIEQLSQELMKWGDSWLKEYSSIEDKLSGTSILPDSVYSYNGNRFISLDGLLSNEGRREAEKKPINTIVDEVLLKEISPVNLEDLTDGCELSEEYTDGIHAEHKKALKRLKDIRNYPLTDIETQNLDRIEKEIQDFFDVLTKKSNTKIQKISSLLKLLSTEHNDKIEAIREGLKTGSSDAFENFTKLFLSQVCIDPFFQDIDVEYRPDEKILVLNYQFLDLDNFPNLKEIKLLKNGDKKDIPLSQKAFEETYDRYVTAVCLRTIYEIFQSIEGVDFVSFNGWVDTINKGNGNKENFFILSIQVKRESCGSMNITSIDPKVAFRNLKGISASKLSSLTPIKPILKINKEDSRFVEGYDVTGTLDDRSNLAAMDWQDFENLIRQLFNEEYGKNGGEVRITQASRDGGVDAIAFVDPDDPIRAEKVIIQAKRYVNTVDVSAVRDLHGTVQHEGANKGILVTTATFGPDAYEFVKNKPLTLIDGSGLLYLLEKHGHSAKIDLREARKILNLKQR